MPQTIGTGAGKAVRQFSSNLYKVVQKGDFDKGPVMVADHLKLDSELNAIFSRIQHADPTVVGSQSDGNFSGALVQFTTPATTGTTVVVQHGMGRIPVGWINIGPAINSAGNVKLRQVQAADTNNLYLKVVDSSDTNILTAIAVW